jgi:hypothetical protein
MFLPVEMLERILLLRSGSSTQRFGLKLLIREAGES